MFFGVVNGIKGYFRRPRRPLGKIVGKLTLRLREQPTAHYKPRFDFPGVIAHTFRANPASADFARNLEKEIAFRIERAAQRTPSPRVSGDGPVAPFRRTS